MKYFLNLIIILCLIGVLREITLSVVPEYFTRSVHVPSKAYDSVARTGAFAVTTDSGTAQFSITSTSPNDITTEFDHLQAREGNEKISTKAKAGEMIKLSGEDYTLTEIRPWSGILPDPTGAPTMSISWATASGDWVENQPLSPGENILIDSAKVELHLLEADESLVEFIKRRADNAPLGRWGILEEGKTLWFKGFTPGDGAQGSDGTLYTLIAFTPKFSTPNGDMPAIRIRSKKGDGEKDRIITPRSTDSQVVLEFTETTEHQIDIAVTIEGEVHCVIRRMDGTQEHGVLEIGRVWHAEILPLKIRLEQYLAQGIFVNTDESPFMEAVLEKEGLRLRIRQGEALRVGDTLLRYQRHLPEGSIRYTLSTDNPPWSSSSFGSKEHIDFQLGEYQCRIYYEDVDSRKGVKLGVFIDFSLLRFLVLVIVSGVLIWLKRSKTSKSLSRA